MWGGATSAKTEQAHIYMCVRVNHPPVKDKNTAPDTEICNGGGQAARKDLCDRERKVRGSETRSNSEIHDPTVISPPPFSSLSSTLAVAKLNALIFTQGHTPKMYK